MTSTPVDPPVGGPPPPPPAAGSGSDLGSRRGRVVRELLGNPLGLVGGGLLLLVVLVALLAPLLTAYSPTQVDFDLPFQRPLTEGYPLGTDDLGRDVWTRIAYGARASLLVGLIAVGLAVAVGTPLGLAAGWWGWLDALVSRLTDLMLAFPFLVIAVGLAAINGASLTGAAVALGISQVPTMVRVVRAETIRVKQLEFVTAAKSLDASSPRILAQHVLPNTASTIIVQATVIMPVAVIGEAILSFLGLGIQPPTPSLGIMLSDAQQYIFRAPSAAIFPGVAIAVICLGFNLFGDALRDALDPTSRR